LNPLASRKQLLLAESELNRAHLVQDWQAVADRVYAVADRARTFGSVAAIAASLVAGLTTLRRKKSGSAAEKPSWLQTLLKGAALLTTVWQAFRSPGRDPDETDS